MATIVSTLGFPRIGPHRELKFALEKFWAGKSNDEELYEAAYGLRVATWARQKSVGITHIPSNDFSFYDHVLDTSMMVGAIPSLYNWNGSRTSLETYFAMARGTRGQTGGDLPALEMTKWFDTNYHYMVPEFTQNQRFTLVSTKVIDEFQEAKSHGYITRPVLLGPITYLLLGKAKNGDFDPLTLLPALLPVYSEILKRLQVEGAEWVQIDEPYLALDVSEEAKRSFKVVYEKFAQSASDLKILLTSYFGDLGDNLDTVLKLPVAGLHLDLVRAPEQLAIVSLKASQDLTLSLGVIDGRNIWRADLEGILDKTEPIIEKRGKDKVILGPSCSLLHVPIDLDLEKDLDPHLKTWLAFATQKMDELVILGQALDSGRTSIQERLKESSEVAKERKVSSKIHNASVKKRMASITDEMFQRRALFENRQKVQRDELKLPSFPTTTIGSFPQTREIRLARASHDKGELSDSNYKSYLQRETASAVRWQEEIGIDVLVHGEFERNDMVQYFGERLSGYAFTKNAWVQSYGSRYVRPPIIFGDVVRPYPMTVEWACYAQSLTRKPMKGMLTGPVTMLQWSFVRDDQPRSETCFQIALALRDEVLDLEKAGIKVIQIDEPALREGLPLRHKDWAAYLKWAVDSFRLSAAGVRDETQIHTHMCYSEFNDIIHSIGAMDADVISIETARSKMELLAAFSTYKYPNEIGPGVYDIHAPRCPTVEEIVGLLTKATQSLSAEQLWVNPDCGLKTRSWDEVKPALINMVKAAKAMRNK